MNLKYILLFPFISSLCIVLNLYNGDILGIDCNYEYILWYIPPLLLFMYQLIKNKFSKTVIYKYICEILVCLFSIISNVYWRYAWIKDAKTNYRHRTEYYDTQCLLSAFLFNILYHQFQKEEFNRNIITNI